MKKLLPLLLCLATPVFAQKWEGLALTPPMGWNSWNTFACDNINEKVVRETADAMAANGMRDAGYVYIVIDDGWSKMERDQNDNLVGDPVKFPSGMKALADYVHSKGFKFGIYSCAGVTTCGGYPASWGHEFQDARTFASWDVDYLKYDWCEHGSANVRDAYKRMSAALRGGPAGRFQPVRVGREQTVGMGGADRPPVAHHRRYLLVLRWEEKLADGLEGDSRSAIQPRPERWPRRPQ